MSRPVDACFTAKITKFSVNWKELRSLKDPGMAHLKIPARNVVVALDGSEHSIRAFNWYTDRFKLDQDQVVLVYVCEAPPIPPPTYAHGVSCSTSKEQWEADEQKIMALIAEFEDKCKSLEIPYESVCTYGHVGEALCQLAKDKNASCVIIGNRDMSRLRRTFMGSNSDYVVKHATMPVLVVPPTEQ